VLRALAILCLAALAACTRVDTADSTGRHSWTKPNVLRIADTSDPDQFDSLLSTMDLVEDLSSLVMSYLVIADGNGKLVGDLATEVPSLTNGGISKDGKTYVYHLHKGVLWHDGKPLTSRDVAFTWRAVVNPRNNVFHREGYEEVASIETPDDTTVVVHLKRRYPPFVSRFFTTLQEGAKPILPAHLLSALPNINTAPFNSAPVGSGPFKFVKWDRGRGITMVRNERYFKGLPKIERVEFSVIPDDNTILDAMKTHEIDATAGVATTLYDRYRGLDGIVAALYPWNAENVLIMNNLRPGLRHLEVRRAIAIAIDYQAIIDKVTHGVAVRAHDILPPTAIGYTLNEPYPYDPAAAREILTQHGWKPGSDGIRFKGSERLDFTMAVSSGSANERNIAIQLQAYLHDVGIGLTLKTYPYNVIFAYDGPIYTRKYDFGGYSYTLPWDPDNTTYLACDQLSPKGENVTGYCDKTVDAGERAGLATDDPAERAAIYHKVQRRIHDTVPYIPMYLVRRPTARSIDLKNWSPSPAIAPWWNAWQWSI
jgi:peptide/nickel transport system substrate-binding protein